MWLNHYKTLFNSVGYDNNVIVDIFAKYTSVSDNIDYVTTNEICHTTSAMNTNEAADYNGLYDEHFRLAGQFCYSIFAHYWPA